MLPAALLVVVLGGGLAAALAVLLSRVSTLEGRIGALERRHQELLTLISNAVVEGERSAELELRIRDLLGGG